MYIISALVFRMQFVCPTLPTRTAGRINKHLYYSLKRRKKKSFMHYIRYTLIIYFMWLKFLFCKHKHAM